MKNLLLSLSRFIVVFLTSSVVFFALVVVAAHLLTPYFSQRAQTIERFASSLLHKPVQIDQFDVVWQGLLPVLQGQRVTIWNDSRTRPLLQIKELDVSIDIFKTLISGDIRLGGAKVKGMDLIIQQTKDNQFVVSGLNALSQTSHDSSNTLNQVLVWLLSQPSLTVQALHLNFYPAKGLKWPDMHLNAKLDNQLEHHRLSAELHFIEKQLSNLTLITDLTGSASAQRPLSTLGGLVYLQGESILLDRWLALFGKKYSIQRGVANFKVWADWQQNHFKQVSALISTNLKSVLRIDKQTSTLTLMPFFANIGWKSNDNGNWSIDTIVKNLGFLPWNKIPGIQGLNAYFHATPTSGNMTLLAKNLRLDFVKLFKAPLHLDNLFGKLNWQRNGTKILIHVSKFDAANADLSVNGQMGLLIPVNRMYTEISLLAHVKTLQPSHIAYYLPQHFVGSKLVDWLNKAIISGSGDGYVLLKGPISEFPFDKNNGTFLIDTQIKNAELHYESSWPNLKQINGELFFSGRKMQLLVKSASIFGTFLKDIAATIPLIKKNVQAVLHIAPTTINTQLENGLAFLRVTPLIKEMGDLSGILLKGPLKLILQFTIPLESGKEKLNIVGLGKVENANAKITAHDLQIDNLKGQFSLSQTGVQAQNLRGLLWKKPIMISIRSTPTKQLAINYDGVQTLLNPEKNGWRFLVNNKTARGSVLIPNDKSQAIAANFDVIHLNSTLSKQSEWNLKQIPKIILNAKDIQYNDIDFGMFKVKLKPFLSGVAIRDLNAGNASYHLIANGVWQRREKKLTKLIGQLDSPDLSGFLRSLRLPATITAEQAHLRFDLQWLGAPYDVNLSQLRGNFSFNAANGQILDVGSSAEVKISFGRLLNFLSLQSLGRRLQLDFSDFRGKGFDFRSLQGNFNLRGGNAYTRDVTIEGPVATIEIIGRIGLGAKDYNLTVVVVPHFTSSLPVIVGLAGGPIAGAITWVANSILGSTVQKIAETSYHITGSWGKPEVVKTST